MESISKQKAKPRQRPVVAVLLLSLLLTVCFGAMYYAGDLSKLRGVVSAEETRTALRDVTDPDQLDQVINDAKAFNGDRSKAVWYVCHEMLRRGYWMPRSSAC